MEQTQSPLITGLSWDRMAVEIYNDLVQRGQAVGGLFHSTC